MNTKIYIAPSTRTSSEALIHLFIGIFAGPGKSL